MLITTLDQIKQLKHGQRVLFRIEDMDIRDAKISINKRNNDVFICNNRVHECTADDMLGYGCSFFLYSERLDVLDLPNNLITLDKTTLEDMQVGDTLVDTDRSEYKVLEVFTNSFLLSDEDDFTLPGGLYTFEGATKDGFKLKEEQPKEEIKEEVREKEFSESLEYIHDYVDNLFKKVDETGGWRSVKGSYKELKPQSETPEVDKYKEVITHLNSIFGRKTFSTIEDVYNYHIERRLRGMDKEELIYWTLKKKSPEGLFE